MIIFEVVASVTAQSGGLREEYQIALIGKGFMGSNTGQSAAPTASSLEFRQQGLSPREAFHQLGLFHVFRFPRDCIRAASGANRERNRDTVCQQWPVQLRQIRGAGLLTTPGDDRKITSLSAYAGWNPFLALEFGRGGFWVDTMQTLTDFESRITAQLNRVLHSVAVNTDLACRFVLADLHRLAAWYRHE